MYNMYVRENLFRLIGSFGYWLLRFGVCVVSRVIGRTQTAAGGREGRRRKEKGGRGREGRHSLGLGGQDHKQ